MADTSYSVDQTTATQTLIASHAANLTTDTINLIVSLSTSATDHNITFANTAPDSSGHITLSGSSTAGAADVVFVTVPTGQTGPITIDGSSAATHTIIFQSPSGATLTGVNVVFTPPTTTDSTHPFVIVGSGGNDSIQITGTADSDIHPGTGNTTIIGGQGHDTVHAGTGNTTIVGGGHTQVNEDNSKSGDFVISGTSTVTAASGVDGHPQASGTTSVVLTNTVTGITTTLTGVQYVGLANNDAIIFAASTVEAGVASLYHEAFGRTGDSGGIDYWFGLAKSGESLHDIAYGMSNSAEFHTLDSSLTNDQFITQLYLNAFNRAPDAGGMTYWQQQLANGATRVDLLAQFASVAALNEQGTIHTETTVVGTVTIVPHIV